MDCLSDTVSALVSGEGLHKNAVLTSGGLTYGLYLHHKPNADTLLVSMSNVIGRRHSSLPSVVPLDWCDEERCAVLSICDPTLYLNDTIQIGAFLGDRERDPIPTLAKIVAAVASRLGVSHQRIVFWGHSGGGFAAMRTACLTGGLGVAVNAQTEIAAVTDWDVFQWMADLFGTQGCVRSMCDQAPDRTSISRALVAARSAGRRPYLILAQNDQDERHIRDHFTPIVGTFREAVGLTYSSSEGHGVPPSEVSRWILSRALSCLSEDRAQAA